jgi:hypothetical protein
LINTYNNICTFLWLLLDNRLIWSDSELDKIESVSLVNTGESKMLISSTREFPVAVDVDDQYVYYIENGQRW